MSDAKEPTFSGVTRGLLGAISLLFLTLGFEMVTANGGHALGWTLIPIGVVIAYVAWAWSAVQKYITPEARLAIDKFAASRAVWLTLIAILLVALTLSPFVEQRRWPFSYPADPAIIAENDSLKREANELRSDAYRWRFSYGLRYAPRADDNSLIECKYSLVLSSGDSAWSLWGTLQPMLELAHWKNLAIPNQGRAETPFRGIKIFAGDDNEGIRCAQSLAKSIGEAFPDKQVTLRTSQASPTLAACNSECVELDVGN